MSKTKSSRRASKAPTLAERDAEKKRLIQEHTFLADERDAVKALMDERKERLLLLMSSDGDRAIDCDGAGSATFTQRRVFEVHDTKALGRMFSRDVLAESFKPTAAFYDAATREGHRIDRAIRAGATESLTVSRSRTKDAKKIRLANIAEARVKTEKKVAELRKQLAQF